MDTEQDKKVLDFFLDDSLWTKKIKKAKKTAQKERKRYDEPEIRPSDKNTAKKELTYEDKSRITNENQYIETETTETSEKGFGEVDYAILKSVTCGFKSIKQISKTLQIRTLVIEKHVYQLIKDGFIKYFQYAVLTSRGKQAIEDFEKNNPEDVWKPIDEFIVNVIESNKEQNLRLQKMIDIILLVSAIVLVILIIYFGFFQQFL